MSRLHIFAFVLARPARSLADLVYQFLFERGEAFWIASRIGKELVDTGVGGDYVDELVNDCLNGFPPSLLYSESALDDFDIIALL